MDIEPFIPFARPQIGEDEICEVTNLLRSGWITTGPKARQFEDSFSAYLGNGVESMAVNSATAGLHLALEALGVGPGDQVVTTTHTFTATAEVIRYLGADPVFVDINRDTMCIDVDAVAKVINRNTKVIIPVHFAGRSAEMDQLIPLAHSNGIAVVEDAAHALPTTCGGHLIGTLDSDVTVFSFYANKTITTGEGGMVVTRNPEIARRVRTMRLHGISRDAFDRFISKAPSWYYEVIAPGFKYNMMDLSAAIGIHQLKKANRFQETRACIARSYNEALAELPIILPPKSREGDMHSWHLYVIQLKEGVAITRDEFVAKMYNQGIGCSVHYIPLHLHPYWRDTYQLNPDQFPVSQSIFEKCVSLPIYPDLNKNAVSRIVSAIKNSLT
jgi:dTDP-4-amino-4,6-dideoxygalactose transaminase